MRDGPLRQLSVKVDSLTDERLKERAKNSGTNVSDAARRILREALGEESELARVRESVTLVQEELLYLRRDLASAVEAILVTMSAGKALTPEQAKAWVDAKLRGRLG